jgi:hypothetical protein
LISHLRALKKNALLKVDQLKRSRLYHDCPGSSKIDPHLQEAVSWLKRAQDAGNDDGVSYGADFGAPFLESYPETTGYIIPTFLKLSDYFKDASYLERAIQMGLWESKIQMASGAVMAGRSNFEPTPAVFNTGMVLLGWAALYERTGHSVFLQSLQRATDWLLSLQESNGDWKKGNSQFANPETTTYNVKAAWGLAEAGRVARIPQAIQGAIRNAEFCLSRQIDNGWYRDCCLVDGTQPLLHTIAYTMQGLIGIGTLTAREDFLKAAARTADSLIRLMDTDGFIPGCIGPDFQGTVDWCCLTGTAQTAVVWGRLFQLTGDPRYRNAMRVANGYLMRHHDIDNADPRLRGGVAGSWPVWGAYGRLKVLSWATNFLIESLLIEKFCIEREGPLAPAAPIVELTNSAQ